MGARVTYARRYSCRELLPSIGVSHFLAPGVVDFDAGLNTAICGDLRAGTLKLLLPEAASTKMGCFSTSAASVHRRGAGNVRR